MLRFVVLAACVLNVALAVQVKTDNGLVEGRFVEDKNTDAKYYAFTCIPYAKAPVGNLRFKAPVKAKRWSAPVNKDVCSACPQTDFTTEEVVGSEDCLTINVYTRVNPKDVGKNERIPVIAYIHGSEWRQENSGDYSPSYFLESKHQESVIIVTFNYRLGALGFLSTGDKVVPGNNGLKDQVMALEWIRDNIDSFGGNRDKVTIYGSSTGAASVRFHMLSPKSKGLFVGAIAQSGNEMNPWAWQSGAEAANLYTKFAKSLGCLAKTNEQTVACLRSKTPAQLIAADNEALSEEFYRHLLTTFRPVTEVDCADAFLSQNPVEIVKSGKGNNVPLIIGMVSREGAYKYVDYINEDMLEYMEKNLDILVPTSSPLWSIKPKYTEEIAEELRQHYKINEDSANLIDLISDSQYLVPHSKLLHLLSTQNKQVYQYIYSYRSDISWTLWGKNTDNLGPGHYDDELMVFDPTVHFPDYHRTAEDEAMSNRLIGHFINFAIKQDPNDVKQIWKPITLTDNYHYRLSGGQIANLERNYKSSEIAFWQELAHRYATKQ